MPLTKSELAAPPFTRYRLIVYLSLGDSDVLIKSSAIKTLRTPKKRTSESKIDTIIVDQLLTLANQFVLYPKPITPKIKAATVRIQTIYTGGAID